MQCLVTGVAGFIGSHIAERLLSKKYDVIGVDCFTDYYPRYIKESNLKSLKNNRKFKFVEGGLNAIELKNIFEGVEVVFHEAAQAGVRPSWGANFSHYVNHNIVATQRILEFIKDNKKIEKFVFASSSSVYGNVDKLPVTENTLTKPISPYGVTKLASENLCLLYNKNVGIPTIALRYFTVYGPRQRPDMGIHKFIKAIINNEAITVYGDGKQTRDFTYIDNIVSANMLAMVSKVQGEVFNIGGGSRITVVDLIKELENILKKKAKVVHGDIQKGDVQDTWADIKKTKSILKYKPAYPIKEGLKEQVKWHTSLLHCF